ncbi:hypothetical protein [Ellagibacter isourolithinifaciens]|uniref:hypothetical protein n=1 Tax=Ellagibacter isourolithinifaciens TaxID=2137581 RepID=UPI003AADEDED
MSAKNTDRQGRLRSKTVAFRMSPEEADLLQRMADASGMRGSGAEAPKKEGKMTTSSNALSAAM